MFETDHATRRTILKAAGVTLGTAVLGSAAYATTRNSAAESPAIEWEQTFEAGGASANLATIAQGTDGAYGVSTDLDAYDEATVEIFDQEGTPTATTDVTEVGHIVATPEGGFLLAHANTIEDEQEIVLVKIDAEGNVVYEKTVDAPQSAPRVTDAVRRPTGGYAIAVTAGAENRGAWLVLVAEDGTRVTTEKYESRTDEYQQAKEKEGVTYSTFYSLTTTSEGGFAFGGRVNYGEGAEKDDEAWVLEVGEDLDMEWEQTFEGSADDIIELQDGPFAVADGQADDVGYTTFTADGEIDSTRNFRPGEGAGSRGIVQRTSGELVLEGYTSGDDAYFLLGVSSDGEHRWTKQFDNVYDLSHLISTTENGLAVTGVKGGDEENTTGFIAALNDSEGDTGEDTPTETVEDTPTPTPTPPPATETEPGTETQTDEEDCEI